jgi:hypothetical protein
MTHYEYSLHLRSLVPYSGIGAGHNDNFASEVRDVVYRELRLRRDALIDQRFCDTHVGEGYLFSKNSVGIGF